MTKSKLRYTLLATVSACALIVSIESQPVRAEDAQNWWVSVDGQYQFLEHANNLYDMPLGDGFGIGAELGWKLDDVHSIVARGRIGRSFGKRSSVSGTTNGYYGPYGLYYSGYTFSATRSNKATNFVGDLEIGRDVGLGALGLGEGDLRVFAGARVAKIDTNEAFQSTYAGGPGADTTTRRSFLGAGPRMGFVASKPLSDSVNFDLAAAGGVLFGKQKEAFTVPYSNFNINSDSRSAVVPNVEASAALKFLLNENTSMSAGYRVDAYFNAIGDFGGSKSDHIIHGPFLKLTIKN